MTRSIASIMDPITKGGHENYKKKNLLLLKMELMSKYARQRGYAKMNNLG